MCRSIFDSFEQPGSDKQRAHTKIRQIKRPQFFLLTCIINLLQFFGQQASHLSYG
jgi:hypothetical protein